MKGGEGHGESAAARAARELVELRKRSALVQAELILLEGGVIEAKGRLEANEQLVATAVQSQLDAEHPGHAAVAAVQPAGLDVLTGLPNRTRMLDHLARIVATAGPEQLALLFLDINNFKDINETLGHAVGDQVLKLVAGGVAATIRGSDMVSRDGGDEFLILLRGVAQASDAVVVADKIVALLGVPRRVGEHVLRLTASIGISVYPGDGDSAQALVDHADAAMCHAKAYGLGSFVFHGSDIGRPRQLREAEPASLSRPLTHYREAEAIRSQYNEELRDANEHLVMAAINAQELQAAAERALRRQIEQLAVVAHELRTPLTPIRMAATMLGEMPAAQLPRLQAIIEQQVLHMNRLVGDLLDVSRGGVGKLRVSCKTLDLLEVIDQAVATSRPAMDARLQHFSVHLPAHGLEVYADAFRMVQVFTNLLGNASKFTPEGGEIALSVQADDDTVDITVSDTGVGLAEEVLANIFDPFVQDARTLSIGGAGLGLGLTVVRELVSAHGGSVAAYSAGVGLGSQFVITLPLAGRSRVI